LKDLCPNINPQTLSVNLMATLIMCCLSVFIPAWEWTSYINNGNFYKLLINFILFDLN
jgi:hypothetical protein